MSNFKKSIYKLVKRISSSFMTIGAIAIVFMMLLTAVDVILRYVFNSPILGGYEITSLLLVAAVFFCIAHTFLHDGHISVELLVSKLPVKSQRWFAKFSYLIVFLLFALITWQSIFQAGVLFRNNEVTPELEITTVILPAMVALGSITLCLVSLLKLFIGDTNNGEEEEQ